jgi:hypothetical protein
MKLPRLFLIATLMLVTPFAFLYHSSICTFYHTGLHKTDLGCQVDFCFSHVYHVSEQFASAIVIVNVLV